MKDPYRLPDPGTQKTKKQIEREVTLEEYYRAQCELEDLREQYGIEPPEEEKKEGKISHMVSSFFERRDAREKVCVNKKKHLKLAIFLGWAGAHRFHAKQKVLGIVYLLTCWSGFSVAMTIIDILEIIPIQADENGNIMI